MNHSEQNKKLIDYCDKGIFKLIQRITPHEMQKYPNKRRELVRRQIRGRILELVRFKSKLVRNDWNV